MSARDCARLAFHLLTDYPEIVETSGRARQDFRPGKREFTAMRNWDWMLAGFPYAYPGTDGLKTGSTKLAGCNFTGTARRDGIRLLSVVMKASSYRTRFTDTRQLFDYGFSVLRRVPGLPPGFSDNGQAVLKVAKGSQETVRISARQAPDRLAGEGGEGLVEAVFKILPDLKAAENTVWAPLALDQVVGHITFSQQPDAVPGYIVPDSCLTLGAIAVVAQEEVGRTGFWYRIGRALGRGWERIIQWLVDKIMEMYKVITLRENRDGMETDHIMVVLGRDLAGGG
jgi:D-alanyl-D-alanine carboxypeptidase (penicillin-binding protein 5/6)